MKLERLITMLTMLLQKERISATDFSRKFGVSVRTIYRDVEALESAGIPMVTHRGVDGGISILDTYKIDKKLFTHNDMSTLIMSLQSLSGAELGTKVNQTLEKIKGLVPAKHCKDVEHASKQIYIDITPWSNNHETTEIFERTRSAIEEQRLLHFDYTGMDDAPSSRTVEPHQLVLKEKNWYLRAYCTKRLAFRTFRLSRMKHVQMGTETFTPRYFDQEMTDLKDWKHERLITISIIVDDLLRECVLNYCHPEHVTELDDGTMYVSLPFVESEMGYGMLLSMGHHCEVISPPHVRQELIRRLHAMRQRYEKKTDTPHA